jgi:hydroxymethylbilane synthase
MKDRLVIGSRGSQLALWQTNFVKTNLENRFPDKSFEIKIIRTTGDDQLESALSKIGDKGVFTRQIEAELLSGGIDLAVHSLKDLQTEQPQGLKIGAVCEREVPNDALVSKQGVSIDDLPRNAKVATGSLRRRSQLLHHRPDLEIAEIRGNVPTRLKKFDESNLDGVILAYAGLKRLGFESRISEVIPFNIMVPAVGQGAIAVEVREKDKQTIEILEKLEHRQTRVCVTAERAFLRTLEGGCQVPIGAYAFLEGGQIVLEGVVGSLDGTMVFREKTTGRDAESLGTDLAEALIEKGAGRLLEEIRVQTTAAS